MNDWVMEEVIETWLYNTVQCFIILDRKQDCTDGATNYTIHTNEKVPPQKWTDGNGSLPYLCKFCTAFS